jgi:DNA-binding CsgD family transcriptional regulator
VTTGVGSADQELWGSVQNLELPFVLVDLRDFTVANFTSAFLEQLHLSKDDVLHRPIYDLYDDRDRENARIALQALADGKIDYFRSHRHLRHSKTGSSATISLWVSAIDFGTRQFALAEACTRLAALDSPLVRFLGYTPINRAIGLSDANGVITTVSNDVKTVLGVAPHQVIGKHLLRTSDERKLYEELMEHHDDVEGYTVALPPGALNHLGGTKNVRCIVASLADSPSFCFILVPGADELMERRTDRVAQLEHRLWRIASEVQASGIFDSMNTMPDVTRFPQLSTLSTRQWEVLSRLLRGERVPSIAESLFVSQSTVRNNLSSIFEKFGVHSQSELISLLLA